MTVDTCYAHDDEYQTQILLTKRDSPASTLHLFNASYMPARTVRSMSAYIGRTYYIRCAFVLVVFDVLQ